MAINLLETPFKEEKKYSFILPNTRHHKFNLLQSKQINDKIEAKPTVELTFLLNLPDSQVQMEEDLRSRLSQKTY